MDFNQLSQKQKQKIALSIAGGFAGLLFIAFIFKVTVEVPQKITEIEKDKEQLSYFSRHTASVFNGFKSQVDAIKSIFDKTESVEEESIIIRNEEQMIVE